MAKAKTVNLGPTKEDTEKEKAIQAAMSAVEKQFGKGSCFRLGDDGAPDTNIQTFSSGSLGLDRALGIGGYPRGRMLEIFGPEASGKTTITLHAIAEIQKEGGACCFIDAEHALDLKYASALGVDVDKLVVSQPDYGEQGLEIAETMMRSGAFDLVVIDSVAALVPKAEIDGDMGDSHVGLHARLMSQACRKLAGVCSSTHTTLFFINQLRMKIGISFGNPETTTGGRALAFYSSMRLDVRRIGSVKEGENVVGNLTRVKVVKNKMAPPFKQVEFDIIHSRGVVQSREVLDLGVEYEIIEKSGAWYSYKEERLGQGRVKAAEFLETTGAHLMKEIVIEIEDAMQKPPMIGGK